MEPRVLVGGVVHDQVGDDPHAPLVGLLDQLDGVGQVAVLGQDGPEVADVVAAVAERRLVERQQPQAVDAEPLEVVELGGDARPGRRCRRRWRRRSPAPGSRRTRPAGTSRGLGRRRTGLPPRSAGLQVRARGRPGSTGRAARRASARTTGSARPTARRPPGRGGRRAGPAPPGRAAGRRPAVQYGIEVDDHEHGVGAVVAHLRVGDDRRVVGRVEADRAQPLQGRVAAADVVERGHQGGQAVRPGCSRGP